MTGPVKLMATEFVPFTVKAPLVILISGAVAGAGGRKSKVGNRAVVERQSARESQRRSAGARDDRGIAAAGPVDGYRAADRAGASQSRRVAGHSVADGDTPVPVAEPVELATRNVPLFTAVPPV